MNPNDHLPAEHFQVPAGSELRLEIGQDSCFITVTGGTAEVFGAALQQHRKICLQHTKLAVFTYEGCSVTLEGLPTEPAYISDDTPMNAYLNASHVINNQRKAARELRPGPVVAIVGPCDSGKTSLAKILVNYAIRSGWNPLLVDTDVGQGMISVPGTIAALQVEAPIEPDEGLLVDAPLMFFYGHTTPSTNVDLYKAQIDRLAQLCKERETAYQGKYQNLAAGTIINTLGWVDGRGKDVQMHICRAFRADVILVLGDDKLHSSMQSMFRDVESTEVVKLPKSGGTVSLSRDRRKFLRDKCIIEYFYGASGELQPSLQRLDMSAVKIFKVAANVGTHLGLLPTGMSAAVDPTRVTKVEPSADMVGQLLAVSYAEDANLMVQTNVAGFVWVQQVDFEDNSLSIMCPHGTPPPTSLYMIGSIKRNLDVFGQ